MHHAQDLLVGGTVLGVVSASIVSGLRKDTVCELCQGTGGASCFGCSGDGKMSLIKRDDLYDKPGAPPRPRDPLGRASRPNECRVCKGVGMLLCSRCKGSGYTPAVVGTVLVMDQTRCPSSSAVPQTSSDSDRSSSEESTATTGNSLEPLCDHMAHRGQGEAGCALPLHIAQPSLTAALGAGSEEGASGKDDEGQGQAVKEVTGEKRQVIKAAVRGLVEAARPVNKRMTMGSKRCVLAAVLLQSFLGQPSQGFPAIGSAPGPPPPWDPACPPYAHPRLATRSSPRTAAAPAQLPPPVQLNIFDPKLPSCPVV
ncbi:hypothetical protein QJQ45_011958 [Haematococcus lacustris]|nr:hypothetical protein QJQ45_011958 [Haematococcus lacustris]